jgi:hypothetical protein
MSRIAPACVILLLLGCTAAVFAQSSSSKHPSSAPAKISPLEASSVSDNIYRNRSFGITCKIPVGWVLRTEELNAKEEDDKPDPNPASNSGRVLLAAFSRPPDARAEDINSSILIAAETAATYPGLKEAAQYFGPLEQVTKAQGFDADEQPYMFTVGGKAIPREDFQKDVGKRVMRQSTLVLLSHGYVVSLTFIGGTEDEVSELIEGLSLAEVKPAGH